MKRLAAVLFAAVLALGLLWHPAFVQTTQAAAPAPAPTATPKPTIKATPTPVAEEDADAAEEEDAAAEAEAEDEAAAEDAASGDLTIADEGNFVVSYEEPESEDYLPYYAAYVDGDALQTLADSLNAMFALPQDVTLKVTECGEANAFYDPETTSIELCYELIDQLNVIYTEIAEDPDDEAAIAAAVDGVILNTLYHELGHALIDLYDLPITGKEEDAVDQLSVLMMIDETEEGLLRILHGAEFYVLAADEVSDVDEIDFWDTHSLDAQRFYHLVCWVFGANPEENEFLVTDEWLPEDRAVGCPDECGKMAYGWYTLLAPYLIGVETDVLPDGLLQEPIEDAGDFVITFEEPADASLEEAYALVAGDAGTFSAAADALNATFALPADLEIEFKQCEEYAYYSPSEGKLTFCYELVDLLGNIFKSEAADQADAEAITDHTENALLFVFFHELGHALIDQYRLPFTGLEEDVVDQLATLIMVGDDPETSQDALDGAEFFAAMTPDDLAVEDLAFWDEHSLNQQRLYNIVCWVYGQDPERYADLVGDDGLPEERAEFCPDEWAKLDQAWTTLLTPFLKDAE